MDLRQVITGSSQPTPPTQNLINPSRIVSGREKGAGFYKSIILDVVAVLSATLFGFTYYRYLTQGLSVWFLLGALAFFATLSVLQVFLAKRFSRTFVVIFLEVIGLLGFFWQDDFSILGITGLVVLVFLVWGYFSGRSRLENSIEVRFFGISNVVLSKFTTGLLIFMILIYVPKLGDNPLVVSQKSFRSFFDWAAGFVNNYYPNLSLNGSFGDFSSSFTKMELQNNPSFENLTPAQQSAVLNQQSQQFEQSFAGNGTSTTGKIASSSDTSDAFYNILQGMMNAWQSQSGSLFDIGWAAVIFIALRSIGVIFIWLAEFIALIFYEILLAAGFMKISESDTIREVIGY